MRVLVTGASGAFGAHAARHLLAQGHEVRSIAHHDHVCTTADLLGITDQITWSYGSILDSVFVKEIISTFAPDAIWHFAALPLVQAAARSVVPVFATNIMGTVHVLEAVRESAQSGRSIRVIYVATDKVYGDAGQHPYVESDPLNALGPYDASKACGDLIARMYASCGHAPALAVVRPCNILAEGDLHMGRVVPRLVLPAIRGQRPTVYRTNYSREFMHAADAVQQIAAIDEALRRSLDGTVAPERVHGQAFNIGSGEQRTLDDIVTEVLRHFPGIAPIWIEPPAISRVEIPWQKLDCSKAQRLIGVLPCSSFESAVETVVAWWRDNYSRLPAGLRSERTLDWHG